MYRFDGQDPDDIVGIEEYDQYDNMLPDKSGKAGKSAKQGKNGKDQSPKEKETVLPVVLQYEGWAIAVVDALQAGDTPSWSKARKTLLPFSFREFHDLATELQKRHGSMSRQFSTLCENQQTIVNRLVADKNSEEQQPNAEWVLAGVKRVYKDRKTALRTYRVYNRMQVIMLRQEKAKEVAGPSRLKSVADEDNIIDLLKPAPVKPARKDISSNVDKDGDKKLKSDKKKPSNKDKDEFREWGTHGQQQSQNNHQQWPEDQWQKEQWPEQLFPEEQHPVYGQQQQPQHGGHFNMGGMRGALPTGAVPVQDFRPEAPMPPPHPHQHPFEAFPGVYPQPEPMNDPRQHDRPDFGQPQFSARRGSHSRPRHEPERDDRHESIDSDKIRRKEFRKMKTELLGEVRGEVRGALREAAADEKVHGWPAGSFIPTTSSGPSTGQDDMWSPAASSDGRRYDDSTPNTSPDRSEHFYHSHPTGSLHRRDSSGYESHRPDGRHQYQDRDYVYKPHDTERERRRENDRGRTPRYVKEQRQMVDDYPNMQQQRRRELRGYNERPPVQRRVTDYPETLPNAEFGRRRKNNVDFTNSYVYGDNKERRSGQRERQPQTYRW